MSKCPQDEDRLQRIKTGDRRLLKQEFEHFCEPFIGYLMKQFQCSKSMAEEVYPDAFSRFFVAIQKGNARTSIASLPSNVFEHCRKELFSKKEFWPVSKT